MYVINRITRLSSRCNTTLQQTQLQQIKMHFRSAESVVAY